MSLSGRARSEVVYGLTIWFLLSALAVLLLGFVHAYSDLPPKCFSSFGQAAWPSWIGCAMAKHENIAGGLVATIGAIIAAWSAWRAVQWQIELQRVSLNLAAISREEDRLDREMPGIEMASHFVTNLRDEFGSGPLGPHRFIKRLSEWNLDRDPDDLQQAVDERLPQTDPAVRHWIAYHLGTLRVTAREQERTYSIYEKSQHISSLSAEELEERRQEFVHASTQLQSALRGLETVDKDLRSTLDSRRKERDTLRLYIETAIAIELDKLDRTLPELAASSVNSTAKGRAP